MGFQNVRGHKTFGKWCGGWCGSEPCIFITTTGQLYNSWSAATFYLGHSLENVFGAASFAFLIFIANEVREPIVEHIDVVK